MIEQALGMVQKNKETFCEAELHRLPDLQVGDIRTCIRYAMDVIAAKDIHISDPT